MHSDYMKSSAQGSTRPAQYPCLANPGWCEKPISYPVQMIRVATFYGSY